MLHPPPTERHATNCDELCCCGGVSWIELTRVVLQDEGFRKGGCQKSFDFRWRTQLRCESATGNLVDQPA